MKNIFKIMSVFALLVATSCDLSKDLDNPNEIPVAAGDVDLLMNQTQLSFGDFFSVASGTVDPLVRMNAMTGGYRYQTAYQAAGLDNLWAQAYLGVLINAKTLIPLAEDKNYTTHVAAAKIMSAYVYMTLADIFSDVPDTEALDPNNFNPVADPGQSLYDHALTLLDEARTELAKTGADAGAGLTRDVFYAGDRTKWKAAANTFELKLQMNLSTIPEKKAAAEARIDALFALPAGGLIEGSGIDLTYKYSATTVPDSRHPTYNAYYGPAAGSAGGYISNFFMHEAFGKWDVTNDPANVVQDPRWRYYFYRQVGNINPQINGFDQKAIGCTPAAPPTHYQAIKSVFCTFNPGFYGRDHGDASGTPPSGPVVTTYGIYPAGGRIDNTAISNETYQGQTKRGDGADGAGIQPIWMGFMTTYMRAEYAVRKGDLAGARASLNAAITQSVATVKAFGTAKGQVASAANQSQATLANYLAKVDDLYDNGGDAMQVVAKEFWLACWGNGVEPYNLYRRTSHPNDFQPTIQTSPGPYFRRMLYPASFANLNSSATQLDVTLSSNRVFWDKNPDTLN